MLVNLVGLHEVAQLAGVSRQAVSNWMVRRKDFPVPLANLASGPVWKTEIITGWLSRAMPTSGQTESGGDMKSFIVGYEYSMRDIHEVIGGDTMSYLPQSGGRIVGGRFKKGEMNPNAPYQIIVGDLPHSTRSNARRTNSTPRLDCCCARVDPGPWPMPCIPGSRNSARCCPSPT